VFGSNVIERKTLLGGFLILKCWKVHDDDDHDDNDTVKCLYIYKNYSQHVFVVFGDSISSLVSSLSMSTPLSAADNDDGDDDY